MEEKKTVGKIAWLGVDGLLVLAYFAIVGIIIWALVAKNDFIIGYAIPAVLLIAVTGVFINYLFTVFKFSKETKQKQ